MKDAIAPVTALLMSVALLLMGSGLQNLLLPVRGTMETFTDLQIGLLGAAYYVGFTLGCVAGPAFIARSGHIRAYLALVSLASTVALLHLLIVEPVSWWIMRGATGFCLSVLFIIIESWLNERSSNDTRGTIFAIYTIINLTVITVGQMMLTLGDPQSFPLFALASILMSLAAVPIALTRAQSPEPVPFFYPDVPELYARAPVAFVGCLAVGLANGAFWALGPVFALNGGLDTTGIAVFMSMVVLGGAVGQWPFGRLSDRIDRRRVIVAICVLAVGFSLGLNHAGQSAETSVFVFGFGLGFFAFPLYSVAVAHGNDKVTANAYVETSSGLLLVFAVGSVLGPILAALCEVYIAKQSLFLYSAAVYALTSAFVVWRITHHGATRDAEKIEFWDALLASKTVAPLDLFEHDDSE